MLLADKTITVFNSTFDADTDQDTYTKTVIKGVSWREEVKVDFDSPGLKAANVYIIRIPETAECAKDFVKPEYFTDPATQYTLKPGDIITKGETTAQTPAEALEKVTILSVIDNRDGNKGKHIKVVGK